MKAFKAF